MARHRANRRFLLLAVALVLGNTGCGSSGPEAPRNLTYSTNPAVYTLGVAIAANTPSSSGGAVASYSVAPSLPSGLSLSASTGVITGTPTAVTATASYTVTASNSGGNTSTSISITVNVPPGIGRWISTAPMSIPRHYQPLTLLHSGKVLTTGTNTEPAPISRKSCELFDESVGTGTWTPTGDMADFHDGAAVVRLPSGKVLAAAGYNLLSEGANDATLVATATAELFDESDGNGGRWTTTGSMSEPRSGGTPAALPSGQVLVVGGSGSSPNLLSMSSAELYDPSSGTFRRTASMSVARNLHSATLLRTGKVLVVGGCVDNFWSCARTGSAELYDPASESWTSAGDITPLFLHVAVLLADGRVLVAGGCIGGNAHSTCVPWSGVFLYDPRTNTWSTAASMHFPRSGLVATLLPSGRVLVAGGREDKTTEVYNPSSDKWSDGPPTIFEHGYGPQASPLASGGWLVAGGYSFQMSESAEIFREW